MSETKFRDLPINATIIAKETVNNIEFIFYKDNNNYKYLNIITGEAITYAYDTKVPHGISKSARTPKDLTSAGWIYWHTDGPYKTTVDWNALINQFGEAAAWMNVHIYLGIPYLLGTYLYNGGFLIDEYWRIDDGYYYQYNITSFRVESYYFADQNCLIPKGTGTVYFQG